MLKKEMKDNQKLKGLDGQMGEMRNDFEDMKRTREEARKQLEAKFQDIYKKLAALKEALETEAKRVNNSLKAFESKFLCLLNELKEELKKDMDDEKKFVRDKFAEHEKHMEEIEKKLEQEREERLKQNQDTLGNIQNRLTLLEEAQKQEKIELIISIKLKMPGTSYKFVLNTISFINTFVISALFINNLKISLNG